MPVNRQAVIKRAMLAWYKQQAKEILGARLFSFSRRMRLEPRHVQIRTQKHIWGSCHHKRRSIHLNWQLVLTPFFVIDYVIVHELCHLIVPDHSRRFWQKVEEILPSYKADQKWLKDNALDLRLP
jgi:predicted metal-dependent hydrolase